MQFLPLYLLTSKKKVMRILFNGEIIEPKSPEPVKVEKLDDKGFYTLSTKNALKLSNYVAEQLGVKLGNKIAYVKHNDLVFIYKTTTEDVNGYPLTKLGLNQSFIRLNHATLWNELKGNDKSVRKFELGEPIPAVDEKGNPTGENVFLLTYKGETLKQPSGKKKVAGKGKGSNVKKRKNILVDTVEAIPANGVLTFDMNK